MLGLNYLFYKYQHSVTTYSIKIQVDKHKHKPRVRKTQLQIIEEEEDSVVQVVEEDKRTKRNKPTQVETEIVAEIY